MAGLQSLQSPTKTIRGTHTLKTAKRRYPTPALEKGLDILELFAHEPSGLTKSDVARRLNRTVSEIFRMLLCLEERGYIGRADDDDRFRLTLKIFRMALEYPLPSVSSRKRCLSCRVSFTSSINPAISECSKAGRSSSLPRPTRP